MTNGCEGEITSKHFRMSLFRLKERCLAGLLKITFPPLALFLQHRAVVRSWPTHRKTEVLRGAL